MQHREKKHLLFSAKIATNVVSTGVVLVFFPDFNIQIMILSTLVKGTDQTEQPFFFFYRFLYFLPFLFRFFANDVAETSHQNGLELPWTPKRVKTMYAMRCGINLGPTRLSSCFFFRTLRKTKTLKTNCWKIYFFIF